MNTNVKEIILSSEEHCIRYSYKEQLIVEFRFGKPTFAYYLYNKDADMNEYYAKSLEDAKKKIDSKRKLYNANGIKLNF